jgi:hypothetical protein
MVKREAVTHTNSSVMTHNVKLLDPKLVHQADHILGHNALVIQG